MLHENKKIFKLLGATAQVAFLVLIFISVINAQENNSPGLKDFSTIIEKTAIGISLKSMKGSEWLELRFNLTDYKPQAIDEYGMTESDTCITA